MKVSNEVYALLEAVKELETKSKTWNKEYFVRCLEAYERGALEQVDASSLYTVITPNNCYYGLTGVKVQESEDTVLLEFELSEASGGTHRVLFKQDQVHQMMTEQEKNISQLIRTLVSRGHMLSLYNRMVMVHDTKEVIRDYIRQAMHLTKRDIDNFLSRAGDEQKENGLMAESNDYFHSRRAFFDMTVHDDEDQFVKVLPELDYVDNSFIVHWSLCNHTSNDQLYVYAKEEEFLQQFETLLKQLEATFV